MIVIHSRNGFLRDHKKRLQLRQSENQDCQTLRGARLPSNDTKNSKQNR